MFEDPQLAKQWNEFTKAPEDEQRTALKSKPSSWYRRRSESDFKTICREADAADVTPEKCFNRLDRRLRTLYRKCHIPGVCLCIGWLVLAYSYHFRCYKLLA
jgi:hypothetical protein